MIVTQVLILQAARHYTAERYVYNSQKYNEQQLFPQARQQAAVAARLNRTNGYAYFHIGTNDFAMQNNKAAAENFEMAARYMPHLPNVLRLLAQSYYFQDRYDAARDTLQLYSKMTPNPTVTPGYIAFLRAQTLYRTNQNGLAAVAFAEADPKVMATVKDYPDLPNRMMQSRLVNAVLMNQNGFAGYMYRRLRNLYRDSPINTSEMFSNTLAQNKMPATISFLESVRRRGDADVPLLKILALAYVRNAEADRALDIMREAVSRDSNDSELYLIMGDILFKQNKLPEAQAHYEQHLRIDRNSAYKAEILSKFPDIKP